MLFITSFSGQGMSPKYWGPASAAFGEGVRGFIHCARFCLFSEHGRFLVHALGQECGGTVFPGCLPSFLFLVDWLVVHAHLGSSGQCPLDGRDPRRTFEQISGSKWYRGDIPLQTLITSFI